ncbi:hypothetical protein PC9H_009741 [Pleurotus ostreatus]|uniref:cellulase n=2 Tax=Pleurotus ostreatus TaxID=5322 RepID=A0A067NCJ9_PLEO1|nr:uncharacterized protein PC9H_009741 [Pleurotus ostreatus]KAF7424434.1 hypothetical protein PC9H_009741 [Pleurotus ostreatus]KDQ24685.1 glycoside hydrolase family 5 protein [Pleurotus ostreatus PC15]UPO25255.1 endoglucanase [Pleurotus ostreatus]
MKLVVSALVSLAIWATSASATAVYGQCGGIGFSGDTTCVSGSSCQKLNDYYSQCLPGAAAPSSTPSQPASTTSAAPTPTSTKFKLFGVNQSGAEFGETKIPGVLGTDYTWPAPSSIDYFVGKGFNSFRIPFKLERLSPPAGGLTSPNFDSAYLASLKSTVSYITGKGAFAIIEPHNYARYVDNVITSTSDFATWWGNVANQFKSNDHVVFDIINEPYGIPATDAFALNQAAVNAIRAAGATSQLILVEGTAWTGAWTWESSGNAAAFVGLTDPSNNIAIEMHQYLDSDGSGTSPTCVSSTIGVERLQAATAWLQQHGFKGVLGEIGAGSNDVCIAAVKGALQHLQQSNGVWLGALWWAAGPWWGDYFQSIEPPTGAAVSRILPEALQPFL